MTSCADTYQRVVTGGAERGVTEMNMPRTMQEDAAPFRGANRVESRAICQARDDLSRTASFL